MPTALDNLVKFLSKLPTYQRKALEGRNSEFTQAELVEFVNWMQTKEYDGLNREYLQRLEKVPAKLRERHKTELYEAERLARYCASLSLPPLPSGRPRLDEIAERAASLKASGKSYAQIEKLINREYGEGTTTRENIRGLLRSRRKADKTDKTPS